MTLNEAAMAGICRVTKPNWANKNSYVKIDLVGDGLMGPWVHLYDRIIQQFFDISTPQSIPAIIDKTNDYEEYKGPLDEEDKDA